MMTEARAKKLRLVINKYMTDQDLEEGELEEALLIAEGLLDEWWMKAKGFDV